MDERTHKLKTELQFADLWASAIEVIIESSVCERLKIGKTIRYDFFPHHYQNLHNYNLNSKII